MNVYSVDENVERLGTCGKIRHESGWLQSTQPVSREARNCRLTHKAQHHKAREDSQVQGYPALLSTTSVAFNWMPSCSKRKVDSWGDSSLGKSLKRGK